MSICDQIINTTLKNYTPATFESLDMSEVLDIEQDFTVLCESFIERLLDSALDSSREAINRKAKERIEHFFSSVESDYEGRHDCMKRLTIVYAQLSGKQGSLMGWKRFMLNHTHCTLKDINEMYFKTWKGKDLMSWK